MGEAGWFQNNSRFSLKSCFRTKAPWGVHQDGRLPVSLDKGNTGSPPDIPFLVLQFQPLTDARRESDKASPDRLGLASSEPSARLLVEEAEASEGTAVENGFPR